MAALTGCGANLAWVVYGTCVAGCTHARIQKPLITVNDASGPDDAAGTAVGVVVDGDKVLTVVGSVVLIVVITCARTMPHSAATRTAIAHGLRGHRPVFETNAIFVCAAERRAVRPRVSLSRITRVGWYTAMVMEVGHGNRRARNLKRN